MATPTALPLGTACVSCEENDIQLQADVVVNLLENNLTKQQAPLIRTLRDFSPVLHWIDKGQGFSFYMAFFLNGKLLRDDPQNLGFLKALKHRMVVGKLLDELGLKGMDVTDNLEDPVQGVDEASDLVLSFSECSFPFTEYPAAQKSKRVAGSSSTLKPPDKMHHYLLHSVILRLNFVAPNTSPPPQYTARKTQLLVADFKQSFCAAGSSHLADDQLYEREAEPMLIDPSPRSSFSDLFDHSTSDPEEVKRDLDSSQSSQWTEKVVRSTCIPRPPFLDNDTLSATLVDNLFRHLASDKPRRLDVGIKADDTNLLMRLADMAPVVFNPDYAKALAAHEPYIDIIAGAVASGLSVLKAPHIKKRYSELCEEGRRKLGDRASLDDTFYVKEVIAANTRRAFAYCLRDSRPLRRPKPPARSQSKVSLPEVTHVNDAEIEDFSDHTGIFEEDSVDESYDDWMLDEDLDSDEDETDLESYLSEGDAYSAGSWEDIDPDDAISQNPYHQLPVATSSKMYASWPQEMSSTSTSPLEAVPAISHTLDAPESSDELRHPDLSITTDVNKHKDDVTSELDHAHAHGSLASDADLGMLESVRHFSPQVALSQPCQETFLPQESREQHLMKSTNSKLYQCSSDHSKLYTFIHHGSALPKSSQEYHHNAASLPRPGWLCAESGEMDMRDSHYDVIIPGIHSSPRRLEALSATVYDYEESEEEWRNGAEPRLYSDEDKNTEVVDMLI